MKFRSLVLGCAVALSALVSVTPALAQNNPIITIDERGVGTIQFPGALPGSLPGVMRPDPGPGGLAQALTYDLLGPPNLLVGDLVLLENGIASDVIRFNGANAATGYPFSVVFYSDNADGPGGSLADTGLPTALYPLVVRFDEVGPEAGPNGFIYTPTPNQPGYVVGYDVTYVIISDPVPEPTTLTLSALGAVAGGLLAWRRRRQAAR